MSQRRVYMSHKKRLSASQCIQCVHVPVITGGYSWHTGRSPSGAVTDAPIKHVWTSRPKQPVSLCVEEAELPETSYEGTSFG